MKHLLIPMACLAVIVLVSSTPARAQESSITETFDEPLGAGWEAAPKASVIAGELVLPPGAFAVRGGAWTNITLTGLSFTGQGELSVNYAMSDRGQYGLHLLDDRIWTLERAGTELAAMPGTKIDSGSPVDVSIEFVDGTHTVSVNGATVLTVTDPDPLPAGSVGLFSGGERTVTLDEMALVGSGSEPAAGTESGPEPQVAASAPATTTTTSVPASSAGAAGWLEDFFAINTTSAGIGEAAANLALAALLAFVLGRVYVFWGAGLSNRRRFAANFMVVAVATTFIILVVRSSVALSLGLVGALSIVRFRAAIKDPEELTYMFLVIGVGIGLGDNQRLLTVTALGIAVVVIGLMRLFRESTVDFNLHVTVSSEGAGAIAPDAVAAALQPHCSRIRLSRFDETPTTSECSYLVEFAGSEEMHAARSALRGLSPDLSVSFLDDKGLW
jgi:hypothetical protein